MLEPMQKLISLGGSEVEYTLRRSARAKRLRLTVHGSGKISLTIPKRFPIKHVSVFMNKKSKWLAKHLERFLYSQVKRPVNKDEYLAHKERARSFATERLAHFNKAYRFSYKRISIRNQRTRWGSCSKKGNLNFNYRIALLPSHLADYIIVHELCHLGAFDHSEKFWNIVAQTIPEHRDRRRELHEYAKNTFVY